MCTPLWCLRDKTLTPRRDLSNVPSLLWPLLAPLCPLCPPVLVTLNHPVMRDYRVKRSAPMRTHLIALCSLSVTAMMAYTAFGQDEAPDGPDGSAAPGPQMHTAPQPDAEHEPQPSAGSEAETPSSVAGSSVADGPDQSADQPPANDIIELAPQPDAPLGADSEAPAETPTPVSLTGEWRFASEEGYNLQCKMTGRMRITPVSHTPNAYECVFVAVEDCSPRSHFTAKQICRASVEGDQVSIVSELVSVDPASYSYLPDNFVLQYKSSAVMEGTLWFGQTRAIIRFDRIVQAIS